MTDTTKPTNTPYDSFAILAITTAYEQGVEKGRQAYAAKTVINNPYDSGYGCNLAWQNGYAEGLEQAERMAKDDALNKRAPVQGYPGGIPWAMHLEAYAVYCKKWSPQPALIDLEGRNCRGGFSTGELDEFIPGWRDRISPLTELQNEVAKLRVLLVQAELQKAVPYEPLTPEEIKDLTAMIWGAPASDDHLADVATPMIRTYEGLRLRNERPVDPARLPRTEQDPAEALQKCVEALEAAKNGLQWYRDTFPEQTNGSDDEMDAAIETALEKSTLALITLEKKDA